MPVYPPREDVQVGDMFLFAYKSGQDVYVSDMLRSFPFMIGETNKFLATRVAFQPTNSNRNVPQNDTLDGTILTRGILQHNGMNVDMLPVVAFPSIDGVDTTVAGTAIGRLMSSLGLGFGTTRSVNLNFNDVRAYGLPKSQAHIALTNRGHTIESLRRAALVGVPGLVSEAEGRRNPKFPDLCSPDVHLGFFLVTKYYLTRQITYTYQSALILQAMRKQFRDSNALNTQPPAATGVLTEGTTPEQVIVASQRAQIDTLKKEVATLQTQVQPGSLGSSVEIGYLSSNGFAFNELYPRPVMIGWEGLPYFFDNYPPVDAPRLKSSRPKPESWDSL